MNLSRERVMEAIERDAKKQPERPRNNLREMRNQVYGGDTSRAAYQAYVIEKQTNGETPVSFEEFRRQRSGKNALK